MLRYHCIIIVGKVFMQQDNKPNRLYYKLHPYILARRHLDALISVPYFLCKSYVSILKRISDTKMIKINSRKQKS